MRDAGAEARRLAHAHLGDGDLEGGVAPLRGAERRLAPPCPPPRCGRRAPPGSAGSPGSADSGRPNCLRSLTYCTRLREEVLEAARHLRGASAPARRRARARPAGGRGRPAPPRTGASVEDQRVARLEREVRVGLDLGGAAGHQRDHRLCPRPRRATTTCPAARPHGTRAAVPLSLQPPPSRASASRSRGLHRRQRHRPHRHVEAGARTGARRRRWSRRSGSGTAKRPAALQRPRARRPRCRRRRRALSGI